jgi:hypothetical protein
MYRLIIGFLLLGVAHASPPSIDCAASKEIALACCGKVDSYLVDSPAIDALFVASNALIADLLPWKESTLSPVYYPYNTSSDEDYYPSVLYDGNAFSGHGDAYAYKMWHQTETGSIALSLSTDGINWTLKGTTDLSVCAAYHARVLYDVNAFGNGTYYYKVYYWNGSPSTTMNIFYAESNDGMAWVNSQLITQGSAPLVDGVSPGWFYHLYGPAFVYYNANATSTPGVPLSYPYVMYYHISTEGGGPGTSIEQTGLAISVDGLLWNRWSYANGTASTEPVMIPYGIGTIGDPYYTWNGGYAYIGSVVNDGSGVWRAFYTGANPNNAQGITYAQGIGSATSADGINWTFEPLQPNKPIFYITDSFDEVISWRDGRVCAPYVIYGKFGGTDWMYKMWFSGGRGVVAGMNGAIGYATKLTV